MNRDAQKHKVIESQIMAPGTVLLRMERCNLNFTPGQYIHVAPLPGYERREYSIYSSPHDDFLEILIKEISGGAVSSRLCQLQPGNMVEVEGPFGFFTIQDEYRAPPTARPNTQPTLLFIATGTGISPFHCLTKAYKNLDYQLLHGTRTLNERYHHSHYPRERLVSCVTREREKEGENSSTYNGRVTQWLQENPPPSHALAYLCGNCDMIYQIYDILGGFGITSEKIHAEIYF